VTDMGNYDSLTVENVPGGAIVVHGDIDVAGGPILEAALLRREGEGVIVIDLGDVYFIDSSGLRSLLGASRRARARGSSVVLKRVGPEVLRLLEITGTTSNFSIETNRD
jgi:anti-anti-sigma factor